MPETRKNKKKNGYRNENKLNRFQKLCQFQTEVLPQVSQVKKKKKKALEPEGNQFLSRQFKETSQDIQNLYFNCTKIMS